MIKKVLLLVGMHRSGTSALAGMFYANGFDLGANLLKPASDNPYGFYENSKIVAFNNELLQLFGASWDMPFNVDFDTHDFSQYQYFQQKLQVILADEFTDDVVVLKDPRLSKLLPFYRRYFDDLSVETKVIVSLRDPSEIADSLAKRNGFHELHSLWLWLSYIIDAEFYSRPVARDFVRYDNLLNDPATEFNRICAGFLNESQTIDTALVDPKLRHFSADNSNSTENETFLHDYVAELFNLLECVSINDAVAEHNKIDNLSSFLLEISTTFFDQKIFPLYNVFQTTNYSKLAVDNGRGFIEWDARYVPVVSANNRFTCEFDLATFKNAKTVRWYPIIGKASKLSKLQFFEVDMNNIKREITTVNLIADGDDANVYNFPLKRPFVEFELITPPNEKHRLIIQGHLEALYELDEALAIEESIVKTSVQELLSEYKNKNIFLFNKRNELETENQNKEETIKQLRHELDLKEIRNQELFDQEKTKNNQLSTIIEERDLLKTNIATLNERIADMGSLKSELAEENKRKIEEMLIFRNELMNELETLKHQIVDKDAAVDQQRLELEETKLFSETVQAELSETRMNFERLKDLSKTHLPAINALKEQLEVAKLQLLNNNKKLKSSKLTTTNLQEKLESKIKVLKTLSSEVDGLKKKQKENKKKRKTYKKKIKNLKGNLSNEMNANDELLTSYEKLDGKYVKLEKRLLAINSDLKMMANSNDKLTNQLQGTESKLLEFKGENEKLEEDLLNEKGMTAQYLSDLSDQELSFRGVIEKLEDEKLSLEYRLLEELEKIDQVELTLISKDEIISSQKLMLDERKGAMKNTKNELRSVKNSLKEIVALNEQREFMSEINLESDIQIFDSYFELIVEIKQQLDTQNVELQNRQNHIASLTDQFREVNEQWEKKEKTNHSINDEKNAQIESLKKDVDDYSMALDEQRTLVLSMEQKLKKSKTLERNNRISIETKLALIDDLKSDLLLKQEDLIRISRERVKYENHFKAVMSHIEGIRNSLSYKFGYSLTSPLRFIYDKISNKPFNKSGVGKSLVSELSGSEAPRIISEANVQEGASLLEQNVWSGNREINYNLDNVDPNKMPNHHPMIIDDSKLGSVLFISPNLPDYDESSGGKRATRMLELLSNQFNVFAFTLGDKPRKYVDKLRDLGVNVLETSRFDKAVQLLPNIHTIIYAWYYTYFDANEFRSYYPNAKIIIDTVDVHWVREFRSVGLMKGLTTEIAEENKKRERQAYEKAAIIWTVTEEDKQEVLKEVPTADIRVVSNIHDEEEAEYRRSAENNILFLGGYRHYPNISAAKILAEKIIPEVRKSVVDAKLILAGSHAPPEVESLGVLDGVEYRGFIEEADISDLYRNTLAIAAPLMAGAGIKGKICEAIVHRVPVVTNDIGNEGINLINEEDGFVTEDLSKMTTYIVDAMKGNYDLDRITSKALDKLLKIVGPDVAEDHMNGSIYPEVSICVVTWNRLELLKKCVESVLKLTKYPRYKLLVHSNGCEDGTREYLSQMAELDARVIPILSDTNDVFVIPNNRMMDMFPENDCILLNNDTVVTENWLMALHQTAYSGPDIGMSGSKLLYPDGVLQEFGSELYADGTGRNIGKWEDANNPEYCVPREVGYVSGCSLYIKRATMDKIGYFDEDFHPCYCEDSDMCYTAKEHGLKTIVTPNSVVYHFEGGTSGTDTDSGFKSYQKVNMIKFLDKHRGKSNGIIWDE